MNRQRFYRTLKGTLSDTQYKLVRTLVRPIYNGIRYEILQPIQNRWGYRRRLKTAPHFPLDQKDVLVITIDCLRADHLSRADYHRQTTPFLDSVGNYYPECVTAASWTFPSAPSILTGLYPHNHGAVYESELRNQQTGNPPSVVRNDVHTLSELLGRAGYTTYFLSAIVTAELPIRGRFGQMDVNHKARASEMVDRLLQWWERIDGSRFAYLHLGDLHSPLVRPDNEPFGEVPSLENIDTWNFTDTMEPTDVFQQYKKERVRFYDNVLRFVDSQLRRLFHELEQRGDLRETLIIITGDHGEEFWERASLERRHFHDPRGVYGTGHGHALVPEVVFVPLITINADLSRPNGRISTTDIVPTILRELGLSADQLPTTDGIPLQNPISDRAIQTEEIAYGYDQQAVLYGDHLLIDSPHEGESVLLDLTSDESIENVALETELRSHLRVEKKPGDTAEIDDTVRQQLQDLGYQ